MENDGLKSIQRKLRQSVYRVDRTIRLTAIFESLAYVFSLDPRPSVKSKEFKLARKGTLSLLGQAYSLNKLPIWEEIRLSRKLPWDAIPEPDAGMRHEHIIEQRANLKGEGVSWLELVRAMATVEGVFRSLFLQFTFGNIVDPPLDEDHETQQLMCGALLRPVCELLDHVWHPARKKAMKLEYQRRLAG